MLFRRPKRLPANSASPRRAWRRCISYKLEDAALAKSLATELESLGHRAVYDAVALAPGQNWRDVLLKALSSADAVVVLLTERALSSQFVMGEIGAARALDHSFGRLLRLPVLVGDMPEPMVICDLFSVRLQPDPAGFKATPGYAVNQRKRKLVSKASG